MRMNFSWVLFLAVFFGATAAQAETDLRAWNIHPDGYPVTEAMKSFIREVNKSTDGRIKIELFSNASLGDQAKAVGMLKTGEIDLAEFNAAPLAEAAPGLKAFNLPFLFTDSAHMFRYLDGPMGEHLATQLKASGFVVLGWYNGGARSFFCANKLMTKTDHFAGQKIRVQQSDVYIDMVKQLDAIPVVLPYKELVDGLQTGKIDCAEGNMVSYESTGMYKVAKYMLIDDHMIAPEALVVSTKLWDKLSNNDKLVFKKAGKSSALLMRELWDKRVLTARATVAAAGGQFGYVKDYAPYIRRMSPIYSRYMADPTVRGELFEIISNK